MNLVRAPPVTTAIGAVAVGIGGGGDEVAEKDTRRTQESCETMLCFGYSYSHLLPEGFDAGTGDSW